MVDVITDAEFKPGPIVNFVLANANEGDAVGPGVVAGARFRLGAFLVGMHRGVLMAVRNRMRVQEPD